ncbi:hypothetical protein TURU_168065 [Turdus rufiventris]|nr:hypothetical protein TURU_168065 [Turdus rufiventris]
MLRMLVVLGMLGMLGMLVVLGVLPQPSLSRRLRRAGAEVVDDMNWRSLRSCSLRDSAKSPKRQGGFAFGKWVEGLDAPST